METRFFVQHVFRISGVGPVPVGNVVEGSLRPGMKLVIEGKTMSIGSLEMRHKEVQEARQGDNVGIKLIDGDYDLLKKVKRQEVVFSDDGSALTQVTLKPKEKKGFLKSVFG